MREHFGEQFTKECYKIFQTILKKLDMITDQQDDILECLDTTTDLNEQLLGEILRKKSLIREPTIKTGGNTPKTE